MISIIIPLWNKEAYIERCLRSITAQTFQEYEIIVVDDGSTDRSAELVANFPDSRIVLIQQPNGGISVARNRGLAQARYPYVAFLDADDEWTPDHLETLYQLSLRYPSCGLFGTSYYIKREGEENMTLPLVSHIPFQGEEGILTNYYEAAAGINAPMHIHTFMVRTEIIRQIGGFPLHTKTAEDLITFARLYAVCDFAYSRKATAIYYLISSGKAARPTLKEDPINGYFDQLLTTAAHRKGVRPYVASWHKRRMVNAIYAHQYEMMCYEFWQSFTIYPWQRKLYTSLLMTFVSRLTGKDLHTLNKLLKGKREVKGDSV